MGTNKKQDNKNLENLKNNSSIWAIETSKITSFSIFPFSISLLGETSPVNKMAAISDRDRVFLPHSEVSRVALQRT